MLEIRYTKKSYKDQTIFSGKPTIALEYISKLKSYIRLLEINPYMGVDCKNKGIKIACKILIFENYNIYYKIEKNYIKILKILNSRQKQK